MSKVTKSELVDKMAEAHETTKTVASSILDTVFETMSEALQKGDEVFVHGFGKFEITHRPARKGRNPKTGDPIDIKASKSVRFQPATALRNRVK